MSLEKLIQKAALQDKDYQETASLLKGGQKQLSSYLRKNQIKLHLCRESDGLLYMENRVWVPDDAYAKVKAI